MRALHTAATSSLNCFQVNELALLMMMTHFQVSHEDDTLLLWFDHDHDDDGDYDCDDDGDDDDNYDNLPSSSPSV